MIKKRHSCKTCINVFFYHENKLKVFSYGIDYTSCYKIIDKGAFLKKRVMEAE